MDLGKISRRHLMQGGAALTLGARRQGVVLSILVLPLYVPPLVFGAGAVDVTLRRRKDRNPAS